MQLQKCPFCGSGLLSIELQHPRWGGNKKELFVVCDDCGSSAPVECWNPRVQNIS